MVLGICNNLSHVHSHLGRQICCIDKGSELREVNRLPRVTQPGLLGGRALTPAFLFNTERPHPLGGGWAEIGDGSISRMVDW